jgi:hypothetical protein
MPTDWSKVTVEADDSDSGEDGVNLVSVQKHCKRVVELLNTVVPGLDVGRTGQVPIGMNSAAVMRASFDRTAAAVAARAPAAGTCVPAPAAAGSRGKEAAAEEGTLV